MTNQPRLRDARGVRAAAATVVENLEARQMLSVSADRSLLVFSDLTAAGASPTLRVNVSGNKAVSITGVSIVDDPSGTAGQAGRFALVNGGTDDLDAGEVETFGVQFTANQVGLAKALLRITTDDSETPVLTIPLRGIGAAGTGGANEPSLQMVLNAYGIPINVGDTTPDTTDYPGAYALVGEEILAQRFRKAAGAKAVTIETLGVFSPGTATSARVGYYKAGSPNNLRELLTYSGADAQTVQAAARGSTQFDPGTETFGLYNQFVIFGKDQVAYSEDQFNTYDAANKRKVRFFPLKDANGNVVPNAYVFASEDFAGQYDSNDVIGIIRNVEPQAQGAQLGIENRDKIPSDSWFVFNRLQKVNPQVNDLVKDTAVMRINNTGSSTMTITSLVLSDATNWQIVNAPAAGTQIAAGSFLDVTIKFVAQTDPNTATNETNATTTNNNIPSNSAGGVYQGTLTVNTDAPANGTRTVTLSGYWQAESEMENEPGVAYIVNKLFGYKTNVSAPSQVLPNQGTTPVYYGEEVKVSYLKQADVSAPVEVLQLAAWHGQLNRGSTTDFSYSLVAWHKKGELTRRYLYRNANREGQRLFPAIQKYENNTLSTTFDPAGGSFGLNLDFNYYTDDALNQPRVPSKSGHAQRWYPVRDADGKLVPNQYLVLLDYEDTQFDNDDHQDGVFLVKNVRPEDLGATPADVEAVAAASDRVELSWHPADGATGYDVYRRTGTGAYAKVNDDVITGTSYVDRSVSQSTAYEYKVVAVNGAKAHLSGDPFGGEVTATTPGTPDEDVTPDVPTGISAAGSNGLVTVTWEIAENAASYRVQRQAAGEADFTTVASGVTGTSYADTDVTNGTQYTYRVVAVNGSKSSHPSATASATPSVTVEGPGPTPGPTIDRRLGTIGSKTKKTKNTIRTSDTDYVYEFTLSRRSKVSFNLSGMKRNADIYLLEPDGDKIRSSRNSGTRTEKFTRTLDAGTYLIRVQLNASKSTEYTLRLSAKAATNASTLPAVPFAIDRSLGELGDSTQRVRDRQVTPEDAGAYFKFTLDEETRVSARLFNLDANADLLLLDASGNTIRSSTNAGTASDEVTRTLEDGTYYLQVKLADGAFATGYSLDLKQA